MGLLNKFHNIRNEVDFFIRSNMRWGYAVRGVDDIPEIDKKFQEELRSFLVQFDWERVLDNKPWRKTPVIVDIGARNFTAAPILEELFSEKGISPEIHGVEIDAYRRLSNFHTRKDYGQYYASVVKNGHYHAMDFLDFEKPVNIAFLLNPFVSEDPLLDWGLPTSKLKPKDLFRHVYELLSPSQGVCLLSSPCPEEHAIALKIASEIGFAQSEKRLWTPQKKSVQGQPRYGVLLKTALS